MTDSLPVRLDLTGDLSDYVECRIMSGDYVDAAEYIRDLIRRDREHWNGTTFERVKAQLQEAFAAPEEDFVESSAEKIIAKFG